jgi:hypothetical protein
VARALDGGLTDACREAPFFSLAVIIAHDPKRALYQTASSWTLLPLILASAGDGRKTVAIGQSFRWLVLYQAPKTLTQRNKFPHGTGDRILDDVHE